MKNVSKQIRIPLDLRDTVTALHIDPAELLRRFIDRFRLFPHFSTLTELEKAAVLSRIRHGLKKFQRCGDLQFDPVSEEINEHYCNLLTDLSKEKSSCLKLRNQHSALLLAEWERELRPLINYPEDIKLETGALLPLNFEFILCSLDFGLDASQCLQAYMKRLSIASLYADFYPGNRANNREMINFFEDLWEDEGNVFLPRSIAQTAVIEEYGEKLGIAYAGLVAVKNYKKRLMVLRPIVKAWANKMKELSPIP